MKDDAVYIKDILHETANIRKFIGEMKKEELAENEMVLRAIERSIQIIGEAAKSISEEFRKRHGEIEWRKIIAMRNFITHDYGEVDYAVVWEVAKRDAPELERKLKELKKE